MSPPPVIREPMAVRTRSRQSVLSTPISTTDAANDVDARPGIPPDRDIDDGNNDAMDMHDDIAKGLSDRENAEAANDASATDARDDVRSEEEHDDEEKRGCNDDGGAENAGVSDGGGCSAGMTFATEEDADDPPTDVSGVDSCATACKYFNATNENNVVEGSANASWKKTTSKRVQSSAARSHKQDDFVKNGARVKAILASALRAVVDGISSNSVADSCGAVAGDVKVGVDSERRTVNDGDFPDQPNGREKMDYARLLSLANEKAEECMALKRV